MRRIFMFIREQLTLVVLVVISAVAGGAASAVVMAAVPDARGVIHGCYRTATGALRVIDSSSQVCTSNETALSWARSIPGAFVTNLIGADFSNASLPYRQFSGTDTHASNSTNVNLTGSDLSTANLANTTFGGAMLNKANLQGANLVGALISGGTIDTSFQNANLTNAQLNGGGDFRGANFQNITINGGLSGNFQGLDFTTANFNFEGVIMLVGDFSNANFSGLSLGQEQFVGSNLNSTNFSGATLNHTFFGSASIDNGVWHAVDQNSMIGTDFTNAHFIDAIMANDLSQAILTGATWSNTTCPDGTNSNNNGNTCIGHLAP